MKAGTFLCSASWSWPCYCHAVCVCACTHSCICKYLRQFRRPHKTQDATPRHLNTPLEHIALGSCMAMTSSCRTILLLGRSMEMQSGYGNGRPKFVMGSSCWAGPSGCNVAMRRAYAEAFPGIPPSNMRVDSTHNISMVLAMDCVGQLDTINRTWVSVYILARRTFGRPNVAYSVNAVQRADGWAECMAVHSASRVGRPNVQFNPLAPPPATVSIDYIPPSCVHG